MMGAIETVERWTRQPQHRLAIDARFAAYSPVVVYAPSLGINSVTSAAPIKSSVTAAIGAVGKADLFAASASSYTRVLSDTSVYFPAGAKDGTIFVHGAYVDTTLRAAVICGVQEGAVANRAIIQPYNDGVCYFDWGGATGGGGGRVSAAYTKVAGRPRVFCGVASSARGKELWLDGDLSAANASDATALPAISSPFQFGTPGGNSGATTDAFEIYLGLIFQKALPPPLIRELSANPWQIFQPEDDLIWIFGDSGGTLAGAASGAAQASGSADLAANVALAAVGVAVAGGSASAGVAIPLSAAGIATAGGAADAAATVTISAAGLATAAGQAGLSASVLLAGAGAAQAAGNAALSAALQAMAAGAAQAGGSATLTGSAPGELSAAGGAVAAGSAILQVTVQIAAAGAAQAGGSATLTGGAPGQITAAGGAQAAGAGTITADVALTAAGFIQAMGAGALIVQVPLSATGAGQAAGAATLTQGGLLVIAAPRRRTVQTYARRTVQTYARRPANLN